MRNSINRSWDYHRDSNEIFSLSTNFNQRAFFFFLHFPDQARWSDLVCVCCLTKNYFHTRAEHPTLSFFLTYLYRFSCDFLCALVRYEEAICQSSKSWIFPFVDFFLIVNYLIYFFLFDLNSQTLIAFFCSSSSSSAWSFDIIFMCTPKEKKSYFLAFNRILCDVELERCVGRERERESDGRENFTTFLLLFFF